MLDDELLHAEINDNNIQIGNSCSYTNNHEYAMEILSDFSIGDRDIIVPLSYSIRKYYQKAVLKQGWHLFHDNFKPLTDFMPLNKYDELLRSVSVAIYGNWRQEAIGNILVSLYLGAKVFLSKHNPIRNWAHEKKLVIFDLENISQEDIDTPLDAEKKEMNKNIILHLYNKERIIELIKKDF